MRRCGILLPISSLPSPYGIGTFGKTAYDFVDFLEKAGQSYWQILPLGQTSYGDSPYQSFSTFAGNPYFIDLTLLIQEGLLTQKEVDAVNWGADPHDIDYAGIYHKRYPLLRTAYKRFCKTPQTAFERYKKKERHWLLDYALFMSIKQKNNDVCWYDWTDEEKNRVKECMQKRREELADDIAFWQFLQFMFTSQWQALKAYANQKGIGIVGDIPIYVALDSADVWTNPKEYDLDKQKKPNKVAGCPPDAFTADGQLWGNPLYNWTAMQKNNYRWWISRVRYATELYDLTRIDHFRGFDEYYAIPYGDKTARNGVWQQGPGMDLFHAIADQLGEVPIIAEDLGFLTDTVRKLLKDCGYPGMKVLQFGFNPELSDGEYLPHNYPKNCIAYTGTHDNSTTLGWWQLADRKTRRHCKEYLDVKRADQVVPRMIVSLYQSVADTVIVPMQDFLLLNDTARTNIPSTVGGNWQWRCDPIDLNDTLAASIHQLAKRYYRLKTAD